MTVQGRGLTARRPPGDSDGHRQDRTTQDIYALTLTAADAHALTIDELPHRPFDRPASCRPGIPPFHRTRRTTLGPALGAAFPVAVADDVNLGTVFETTARGETTTCIVDSAPPRRIRDARVTPDISTETVTVTLAEAGTVHPVR